jgi:hypothetical protein
MFQEDTTPTPPPKKVETIKPPGGKNKGKGKISPPKKDKKKNKSRKFSKKKNESIMTLAPKDL